MQSATQGRDELTSGKDKVSFVDSYTTAMAMGFQVLAAAKAAAQGASVSDCKKLAEEAQKTSGVYFVVDTLEFLPSRRQDRRRPAFPWLCAKHQTHPDGP